MIFNDGESHACSQLLIEQLNGDNLLTRGPAYYRYNVVDLDKGRRVPGDRSPYCRVAIRTM